MPPGSRRTRRTTTTPEAKVPEIRPLDGPLLCLDVSSTAAGWAVYLPDGRPADFGVIRPRPARAPAVERIDRIVEQVAGLHRHWLPAAALMEWSAGKTHRRIAHASGLAVLGQAQGAVRQALAASHCPVATVGENEWTGSVPKHRRAARLALVVPAYAAFRVRGEDPGDDAADALGLGAWWFARAREAELLRRAGVTG